MVGVEKQQYTPLNHGQTWEKEDTLFVVRSYFQNELSHDFVEHIAQKLERTPGAINGLLRKLGLVEYDKVSGKYVKLPNVDIEAVYEKIESQAKRGASARRRSKRTKLNSFKDLSPECSSNSSNAIETPGDFDGHFELSVRAENAIKRMGISDHSELKGYSFRDFIKLSMVGWKTARELEAYANQYIEEIEPNSEVEKVSVKPPETNRNIVEEKFEQKIEIAPISEFIAIVEMERLLAELAEIIDTRKAASPAQDRNAEVLRCRLFISEFQTLADLGKQFDVTRERIRQIEAKLFGRFCSAIRAARLEPSRQIKLLVLRLRHQYSDQDEFAHKAVETLRMIVSERHLKALLLAIFDLELPDESEPNSVFADTPIARSALIIDSIQSKAIPPATTKIWKVAEVQGKFKVSREINDKGSYGKSISFYSQKRQDHVFCESRLEMRLFQALEGADFFEWYCPQPLSLKYPYDDKDNNYFPDAFCLDVTGVAYLIEAKPLYQMVDHRVLTKLWKMREYAENFGIHMLIMDDRGNTIHSKLINEKRNLDFEKDILEALSRTERIYWSSVKQLYEKHGARSEDHCKLVLYNNLKFTHKPWSLGKLDKGKGYTELLDYFSKAQIVK